MWVLKSSDLYLKVTFWPWFGSIIWGVFGVMISKIFLQPTIIWLLSVAIHLQTQIFIIINQYYLIILKMMHISCILAHLYSLFVSPFQEKNERGKIEFRCCCSFSMLCTKLLTHTEKRFSSLIFLLKLCSTEWGLHESHDWFWKCNLNLHLE